MELSEAASHGNVGLLRQLLTSSTIDINARYFDSNDEYPDDKGHRTALQIAASNGHTNAVQLLIKHGADISLRSSEGQSTLMAAASGEHAPTVKVLLDTGFREEPQPQFRGISWEDDILQALYAVLQEKERVTPQAIATLELLLDAGADVNESLNSPWDKKLIHTATALKSIELIQLLVDRGAYLPFDILEKTDDYNVIAFLLRLATKSIPKPLLDNSTGITTAACAGNLQTLELLLMYADKADIQSDQTALVRGAAAGHTDVVSCLLDHGYDINFSSDKFFRGGTPLTAACRGDNRLSSSRADANMVSMLLERGASIRHQDLDGNTALHFAYWTTPSIVHILLHAGADPSTKNSSGNTPLSTLCAEFSGFRYVDDLSSLITSLNLISSEKIDSVNTVNKKGETALHVLSGFGHRARPITSGHFDWPGLLIERGADLRMRNRNGETAGELFARSGCEQVMQSYMYGDSRYRYACLCLFDSLY